MDLAKEFYTYFCMIWKAIKPVIAEWPTDSNYWDEKTVEMNAILKEAKAALPDPEYMLIYNIIVDFMLKYLKDKSMWRAEHNDK